MQIFKPNSPFCLGIAGYSGSGKTTLLTKLVSQLTASGKSVSTLKHIHHELPLDTPGKDSDRHAKAGAEEVMVISNGRYALMGDYDEAQSEQALLEQWVAKLALVDIVFIEGWKFANFPKIEIFDPALNMPLLAQKDRNVKAVISKKRPIDLICPWFDRDDVQNIMAFILTLEQDMHK